MLKSAGPSVPIDLFGWVIDGTFVVAALAAAASIWQIFLSSRQSRRTEASLQIRDGMDRLLDKRELSQDQGLRILGGLSKSRWVSKPDRELAQSSIEDYTRSLRRKISGKGV